MLKKINWKEVLNKKVILMFFLLIPFFLPAYFVIANIGSVLSFNKILKILSLVTIGILYLKNWKTVKKPMVVILIILYQVYLLLTTLLNGANTHNIVSITLNACTTICIVNYFIQKDARKLIKTLLIIYEILVFSNFISVACFPNGLRIPNFFSWEPIYFLGIDNTHITVLFPAIVISLLYSYMMGDKVLLRTKLLLLIVTATFIITWSATSLIAVALIWVYILLEKFIRKNKYINLRNFFIVFVVIFLLLIIFRVQNVFSFFIEDMLHKDMSFTGRTYVWDHVMNQITKSPIIGFGNVEIGKVFFFGRLRNVPHAHNMILNILFTGGCIGFILFATILFFATKTLQKENTKIGKLLSSMIAIYLFITLVESYQLFSFFLLLTIASNISFLYTKEGFK